MRATSCAVGRRDSLSIALVSAWLLFAPSAQAQTSASDKALAENLFDRGIALMRQGQFAEACAQLEQSNNIEHGIGTMLYLAECYEKLGRTASAWAMFREASSAARAEGQIDRSKTGTARADKLEPQLSKLTIHVNAATAAPGLMVLRNGEALPPGVWGVSVPIDPGEQHIEARAPERLPWSVVVTLPPNGATLNIDVPELAPAPRPALPLPAASASSAPAPSVVAAPLASTAPLSARSWQKPVGLVVGGVGVVGLALGAYFGAHAIAKKSDLDHACPGSGACGQKALYDQANSAATASNVLVIAGAALLAGGVVLYFTSPSRESAHVAISGGPGTAEISLRGKL